MLPHLTSCYHSLPHLTLHHLTSHYITSPHITSPHLTLSHLISSCILNSILQAHPNELQILMAVVKYKTNLLVPRVGVCSTWLASLDEPGKMKSVRVPVWIKTATITFPKQEETPVIMIGPGKPWGALTFT